MINKWDHKGGDIKIFVNKTDWDQYYNVWNIKINKMGDNNYNISFTHMTTSYGRPKRVNYKAVNGGIIYSYNLYFEIDGTYTGEKHFNSRNQILEFIDNSEKDDWDVQHNYKIQRNSYYI